MAEHTEPRYRPDLNEGLGGSIELGDDYLFPVELPARKVREILENQSGDDTEIRGSTFPYFSLYQGQGKRVDLLHSYGEDEPVDAIAVYDTEEDETLEFYTMEELVEGDELGQSSLSSSSGEP